MNKLRRAWTLFASLLLIIFGSLRWSPPGWVVRAVPRVVALVVRLSAWAVVHRARLRQTAIAAMLLTAAGVGGWVWYSKQPKPRLVTVSLVQPHATELVDGAKPEPLVVEFDGSAAPLEAVGKPATAGVEMSPKLEGKWTWESDSRLRFEPAGDWPVDQEETIYLDKGFFPRHLRLNAYKVTFKTPSFSIVSKQSEYYQHPDNPKEKRVTANLRMSHPVDPESVKGKVSIEITGDTEVLGKIPRTYKAEVNYDKRFANIQIVSEIMPLPLKDTTAKIKIEKGVRSSRGGNKIERDVTLNVDVPGMLSFFKIERASFGFAENREYALEQVVTVETTTEVLEGEFDKAFDVYLLPRDGEGKRRRQWAPGEVTAEVLAKSKKLAPTRVPSERPQTRLHAFKIGEQPADRFLYVRLKKGLKSFHEYVLAEEFSDTLRVRPYEREVRILHEGSLLAMSGDRKLSILTRGVNAVQVEVAHVLPDNLAHLISQTYNSFSNPSFQSSYNFNWDNITEKFTEVIDVAETKTGKPQFAAFDAGKFVGKGQGGARGVMMISLRPYDRERKVAGGSAEQRLLLVTDLGIVRKKSADGSYDVFVQSIQSGNPVAGARVQVIGRNGLAILSGATDGQGRYDMPTLKDFKAEKEPIAVVVQHGADLSFLPFNRSDRDLSFSRFDVGGVRAEGGEDRLQAYVFTDRGLYRPGETFHVAGVVRSFDWKTKLAGVPLEWVITDPKDQEIYKEKGTLDRNGFLEVTSSTQEASFTGTYTASLYLIENGRRTGLLGSTTMRIEEFVPDRMKIQAGFSVPETAGWVSPDDLKSWVRVHNLFGFPAEGRRVVASYSLRPAAPVFAPYKDYRFYFPKTEKTYDEKLSEEKTDAKGEVEYALDLAKFEKGSYHVSVEAEAFEAEGGRSVMAATSIMVSPYRYFIGYKTDADLTYLRLNTAASVRFLAVDPALKKTAVDQLTLKVIEKQWVSVLTKQSNGTFRYESVKRDKDVSSTPFKIAAGGSDFALPTNNPGDYRVAVVNAEGAEVAALDFAVVGQTNVLGRLERNAELQIKLAKADFAVGEEVEMQIRAPYVGSGLITIEREKVYAVKWFRTTSNNSMQTIKVPAGLEGNAYINVTFLRDLNSREIFMSPLSYGVVPFSIDLKKRELKPELKVAAEHRPGQPLKIEFSAAKPGKIVVFAVDEGILQVAKYQTPDPLKTFFRKRALEVETSQLLDLVLPEYRVLKELAASGGDGDAMTARNLNPFKRKGKKPVAYWSGIIDVGPNAKSVTYDVPDYFNGTLRVMAVAVAPDAIGVARTNTLVRGDFILSPTVPFVLTPGDEAIIGVGVFNNLKGSGAEAKVKLDVKSTAQLEILEGGTQELTVAETKETAATIRVRAKDALGSAELTFTASASGKSAKLTESVSLRPASPYRTQIWVGTVEGGSAKIDVARDSYPEFAKQSVGASKLPLGLARALTAFLDDFPHGCTEQIMSKAIPTLVLGDKPEFKFTPEQRDKAFRTTIATLRQRRTGDGGFGLWSSYGSAAPFPSLYSIHYLVEAKDRGFNLPDDLLEAARGYLNGFANKTATNLVDARHTAYALYLIARTGVSVGNEVNTLTKEIAAATFKKEWPADLGALFLASTLKLMKQDQAADALAAGVTVVAKVDVESEYFGVAVHDAYVTYLLAKHFPARLRGQAEPAVKEFVTMIQQSRYNTLNSALAILALEAMSRSGGETVDTVVKVSELLADGKASPIALPAGLFPRAPFSPAARSLEIASSGAKVYYDAHRAGYDRRESLKPIKQKIEVQREYVTPGTNSSVGKVKMGAEVEVHLKVRSLDAKTYGNVAIVDLLPSGFEVVLERSAQTASIETRRRSGLTAAAWDVLFPRADAQEEDEGFEGDEPPPLADEETSRVASDVPNETSAEMPTLALAGSTFRADFEEPREDRVVLYGSVGERMTEYRYKIKATNRGTFTVPPAFAESLYDRSVQSMGPAAQITVIEP